VEEGAAARAKVRGSAGPLAFAPADSITAPAVPTKRAKAKGKAVQVDSGDESDEYQQPRKKARQSLKAKQRKQKKPTGKFFVLERLPLEMIHEVRPSPLVPLARRLAS